MMRFNTAGVAIHCTGDNHFELASVDGSERLEVPPSHISGESLKIIFTMQFDNCDTDLTQEAAVGEDVPLLTFDINCQQIDMK